MPVTFDKEMQEGQQGAVHEVPAAATAFALMSQQLKFALRDAEQEVADMVGSFIELSDLLSQLESGNEGADFDGCNAQIAKVLEGMQFFDALSQRVQHVADTLISASQMDPRSASAFSPLFVELKKRYSTAAESDVHEKFLADKPSIKVR